MSAVFLPILNRWALFCLGAIVKRLSSYARLPTLCAMLWSMQSFGAKAAVDTEQALADLRYTILQLSGELQEAGINTNCAPVLDVLFEATHDAIGDRAFSEDPEIASRLALSACRHFLAAGITPIIKHIPGQGRAASDSHKDLPRISALRCEMQDTDFKPFKDIVASDIADQVWAMAAHIVYEDIDPDLPSSASPKVIEDVIRGDIGFDGFLLSDDLNMDALSGLGVRRAAMLRFIVGRIWM